MCQMKKDLLLYTFASDEFEAKNNNELKTYTCVQDINTPCGFYIEVYTELGSYSNCNFGLYDNVTKTRTNKRAIFSNIKVENIDLIVTKPKSSPICHPEKFINLQYKFTIEASSPFLHEELSHLDQQNFGWYALAYFDSISQERNNIERKYGSHTLFVLSNDVFLAEGIDVSLIRRQKIISQISWNQEQYFEAKTIQCVSIRNLIQLVKCLNCYLEKKMDFTDLNYNQDSTLIYRKCIFVEALENILRTLAIEKINNATFLSFNNSKYDNWLIGVLKMYFKSIPFYNAKNDKVYYVNPFLANVGIEDETALIVYLRKCILKFILTSYDAEIVKAFSLLSKSRSEELIEKYLDLDTKISDDVSLFFDYIYSIKATYVVKGQYRAGRDDTESTTQEISFPFKKFVPSKTLINLLNKTLGMELSLQNNIYTWHSFEHEYVAGLAESLDDSKGFLLKNLSKIEEMIISNTLNDKKWLESISKT